MIKGSVIEWLANVARIDGTYGMVQVTLLIMLDSVIHGQTVSGFGYKRIRKCQR